MKLDNPKVFISYSWSNPEHEQWVIEFATQLRENGVDIILDKWDLKEGHDAVEFMEKMVKDCEKVIIVCDRIYAEKADKREGGVGTETQIISKEIYDKTDQNKFVLIATEKDENGKVFLPIYYKSRIYIDLSDPGNYTENFEKLLRWIYNKPLYEKPPLGNKPNFLENKKNINLGTEIYFRKTIEAIRNMKPNALGILNEYFEIFVEKLEKFRIKDYEGEFFDDAVITNIESFLPYRNEIIQLFSIIAKYDFEDKFIESVHRFFESLIPYMFKHEHIASYQEYDFDNFRFIIHELFLYAIAIFIKSEKFHYAATLLTEKYYVPHDYDYSEETMKTFTVFGQYMGSLEERNSRLNLRRLSLRADLLKERCQMVSIKFRDLMQTDFILFIRSELYCENSDIWWPYTLIYLGYFTGSFEIFARAESKKYFEKIKRLFEIESPDDLKLLLKKFKTGERQVPYRGISVYSLNPARLLNIDRLAIQS